MVCFLILMVRAVGQNKHFEVINFAVGNFNWMSDVISVRHSIVTKKLCQCDVCAFATNPNTYQRVLPVYYYTNESWFIYQKSHEY